MNSLLVYANHTSCQQARLRKMESPAKILYELQEIDLTIITHQQRLEAIAHALEDSEVVQTAQAKVKQVQENIRPLEAKMKDLEYQAQSTRQKREQTETRLYSGIVSNPKELSDMQQSIASLGKWQGELEDKILELMIEVEATQEELNQAQELLQNVQKKAESDNLDLLSEKDRLQSAIEDLRAERQETVNTLSKEHLKLYETMQAETANRPISALTDDDCCTVCGVQQRGMIVQAVKRDNDLIRCENCARILVYL